MKMTATKKRLLSGMLAGAVLLAGTISYAGAAAAQDNGQANARMERRDNMRPGQMPQLDASKIAKHVAEQFGVKESEVLAALNDKRNFRDIAYTAGCAEIPRRHEGTDACGADRDDGGASGDPRGYHQGAGKGNAAKRLSPDGHCDGGTHCEGNGQGYPDRLGQQENQQYMVGCRQGIRSGREQAAL